MSLISRYPHHPHVPDCFSEKNIELMPGKAITLFARNRLDFPSCWATQVLPVLPLIEEYYRKKGRSSG